MDEQKGQVCYQDGKMAKEAEWMDYLEFVARITSHIPDKGLPGSNGPANFIGLKASLRFVTRQTQSLTGFDIPRAVLPSL